MPRDDDRLAAASRVLRHRQSVTQQALAGEHRSRHTQRLLETGLAGRLQLDDIRAHFAKLGATVRVTAWWNGATLDRLLDERHARVVEIAVRRLQRYGWSVQTEVSFSEYGERGSLDFLAFREAEATVVVGEAKSAWGSIEETLRVLDTKERLAPKIARLRLGWQPRVVATLLTFPEDPTARRVARQHSATMAAAFPARNRDIRQWLRTPSGPLRGLWFLSDVREVDPPDRD
jgi:hypothetical protein